MYLDKMQTNKHSLFFTLAFAFVLLTSCGSLLTYSSEKLMDLTSIHQQIAILPVKTNTANSNDALQYQLNLYHALLRQTHRTVRVPLQPVHTTNSILQERKISPHKAWEMAPEQLAILLGVDAVVKLNVIEEDYQKDESLIHNALVANNDADLSELNNIPVIPKDAKAVASIYDTESGELLWKLNVSRRGKGDQPSEAVIEDVSKKIAKKFPYKWE